MKLFYVIAATMLSFAIFAVDNAPLQPVVDPQPILQALQLKMSSLGSVYFELTQERHLKLFTDPLQSEGFILIARPDQIRWETTSPYQSILLGDKKSIAQFEFTDGKWEKLKLGFPQILQRVMDQMSLMNQGKLDALTGDYTISVATNSSVAMLTLVPKNENARTVLSSLEVKMLPDFSATREVVMNEPNGDFTRILFRLEKRNVEFPPGTFDQAKPLGIAAVKAAVDNVP